jgi:signal transduction histidine kinase
MGITGEVPATALDRAPFTVAILDADGTVVWVNEAWRAFGRANGLDLPDDGMGANYLDVTAAAAPADEDAGRAATGLRDVLDGRRSTFSMVYPCHSPDERRWFRLHATLVEPPSPDADGGDDPTASDAYCLVTHQNITEPIRRERVARRQRDELERLASMLSHDLRNPLAVARGWSNFLSERGTYDARAVASVEDALVRIDAIVDDAVTLLRAGLDSTDTEPCSLAESARLAWQAVDTTGGTLVIDDDLTLSAHPGLLTNLLENLLRNSIEHGSTDRDHGVEIGVGTLADDRGFYVEDDGPGVPEAHREDVFDFGFSTDDGSGFGLAIVEYIASLYDWHVDVTDGSRGGARFRIQMTGRAPGI